MTKEEKELLLKDLCARLPYGVILDVDATDWKAPQGHIKVKIEGVGILFKDTSLIVNGSYYGDKYKPYLRPMSSMIEEESAELSNIISEWFDKELFDLTEEPFLEYALSKINYSISPLLFDWLNAHHFDYRGLIEKGLAIAVTEKNNPYKS